MINLKIIKYKIDSWRRTFLTIYYSISLPKWLLGKIAKTTYISVLLFLAVTYVYQINSSASIGYEMRDLQRNNEKLKQEIRNLDVQVAKYSALSNLEEQVKISGLVKATNISYISSSDIQVAKK